MGRVGWGSGRQIFSTEPIIHHGGPVVRVLLKEFFCQILAKEFFCQILVKIVLDREFYFEGKKLHLSLRLEMTMNSPETLLPSVQ